MNRAQRRSKWLAAHRRVSSDSAPVSNAAAAAVRLHIRELVLHGFPSQSRYSIAESTRIQLTTLLTEQGIPSDFKSRSSQPFVDAGSFQLASNARPNVIGALVAGAIIRGVK